MLDPAHPLVSLPNVVLTPHIGGATYDTEANHTELIADGLARLLAGERPHHIANPEVLSVSGNSRPTDEARAAVLAAAKEMLAHGLVEGTSGNISGRVDDGHVCLTPVVGRLRHHDARRPRRRRPRRQRGRGRPQPHHREGAAPGLLPRPTPRSAA